MKRIASLILALALMAPVFTLPAQAKTIPAGQTVGIVLFTITNKNGDEILVSQISVEEMEADMKAGKISTTLHNYSLLDRFVTTVHQEAQGFTVQEFIDYAKSKSPVTPLINLPLSFSGASIIRFWEIDQTGFDDMDSYTYADLYGTQRYNFPALYEYWNYETQQLRDVDAIWESREPATFLLAVRAFSQRYMVTSEKFGIDYNMENYWQSKNLLDNARALRVMKPMTEDELFGKKPTAADSRYWVSGIRLDPENAPDITPLGKVAAPTAVMTEAGDNYYIRFSCATSGATILYNHNYISPSYTPTSPYGGSAVVVPKSSFPSGTVTMTARAVKEGYTDAGVVTLQLTSSGAESQPVQPGNVYSDVEDTAWYASAVDYVMTRSLFDAQGTSFMPDAAMTRAMLVTALYRLQGSPDVSFTDEFSDITKGTPLSAAVSWAYAAGVVNGMGDGTFAPDASITREQIAAMFYRYAGFTGADTSARGNLAAFTDAGKISDWALAALTWANGAGIINGMDNGTVAPQGTATRAQVAQIMLNYAS